MVLQKGFKLADSSLDQVTLEETFALLILIVAVTNLSAVSN